LVLEGIFHELSQLLAPWKVVGRVVIEFVLITGTDHVDFGLLRVLGQRRHGCARICM